MKVLWLTSSVLPYVADKLRRKASKEGVWLKTLSEMMLVDNDIEFVSVFASNNRREYYGKDDKCTWYSFYAPKVIEIKYNRRREGFFRNIIKKEKPDIIHIWGTEYVFALEMVNAAENNVPVVISIQGIISECADKYTYKLSNNIINSYTFHDIIKKDNIAAQQRRFRARGRFETETLKKAKYVIGRTCWDREYIREINPNAGYYECEEILRPEFYSGQVWSYSNCRKHTLFMSQSYYPIKGMHIALDIIAVLREKYPDIRLYTTGRDARCKRKMDCLRQNSYERYISRRIQELSLDDAVIYLGNLNAEGMLEQYLSANVYLQASVLENSPNSLSEAMMTGVPVVASDVGGTSSVVGEYGKKILYDIDDTDGAASFIDRLFSKDPNKEDTTLNSIREYALQKHDRHKVYLQYMDCYINVLKGWSGFV